MKNHIEASAVIKIFDHPEKCNDERGSCNNLYEKTCSFQINKSGRDGQIFPLLEFKKGCYFKNEICKFIWEKEHKNQK